MSTDDPTPETTGGPGGAEGRPPTEAELMAAYEEQMKSIRVEEIVVQSLASLVEIGGRRAGLVPGAQDEADADQLQVAIEAIRALQPIAAPLLGPNASQIEQALSQLQIAYAKLRGGSGEPAAPGATPDEPSPAKPASSRLWVPGQ